MTDYFNVLMQTQAPPKLYQTYLEEQMTQSCCNLATQQAALNAQQQTQCILDSTPQSFFDHYFMPQLISMDEIRKLLSIDPEPYKVSMKYCCDDGSSLRPKKTNCVNCGAALQGRHKCIYCDTYNE